MLADDEALGKDLSFELNAPMGESEELFCGNVNDSSGDCLPVESRVSRGALRDVGEY